MDDDSFIEEEGTDVTNPCRPAHNERTLEHHHHQVLVGCESGVALYDALTHGITKSLAAPPGPAAASGPSPAGESSDDDDESSTGSNSGGGSFAAPLALNDLALSAARRDKFLMSERVRQAGLRAARQLRTAR